MVGGMLCSRPSSCEGHRKKDADFLPLPRRPDPDRPQIPTTPEKRLAQPHSLPSPSSSLVLTNNAHSARAPTSPAAMAFVAYGPALPRSDQGAPGAPRQARRPGRSEPSSDHALKAAFLKLY